MGGMNYQDAFAIHKVALISAAHAARAFGEACEAVTQQKSFYSW